MGAASSVPKAKGVAVRAYVFGYVEAPVSEVQANAVHLTNVDPNRDICQPVGPLIYPDSGAHGRNRSNSAIGGFDDSDIWLSGALVSSPPTKAEVAKRNGWSKLTKVEQEEEYFTRATELWGESAVGALSAPESDPKDSGGRNGSKDERRNRAASRPSGAAAMLAASKSRRERAAKNVLNFKLRDCRTGLFQSDRVKQRRNHGTGPNGETNATVRLRASQAGLRDGGGPITAKSARDRRSSLTQVAASTLPVRRSTKIAWHPIFVETVLVSSGKACDSAKKQRQLYDALLRRFEQVDTNGSGSITLEQQMAAYREQGAGAGDALVAQYMETQAHAIDVNAGGEIERLVVASVDHPGLTVMAQPDQLGSQDVCTAAQVSLGEFMKGVGLGELHEQLHGQVLAEPNQQGNTPNTRQSTPPTTLPPAAAPGSGRNSPVTFSDEPGCSADAVTFIPGKPPLETEIVLLPMEPPVGHLVTVPLASLPNFKTLPHTTVTVGRPIAGTAPPGSTRRPDQVTAPGLQLLEVSSTLLRARNTFLGHARGAYDMQVPFRVRSAKKVLKANDSNLLPIQTFGFGSTSRVKIAKVAGAGFCAVKIVEKRTISSWENARRLRDERAIMLDCDHTFVISCLAAYQDEKALYFAMEFAHGGELFAQIYSRLTGLSSDESKFYAVELLSAVEHIHFRGFVHRDIRPENVVIDQTGHVKLIDFGNAAAVDKFGRCFTTIGNAEYCAPEMLTGGAKGYTKAVDYWSLACVFYEMLACRTPFGSVAPDAYKDALRHTKDKVRWGLISGSTKSLLKAMLVVDLDGRLCDARLIKEHECLSDVQWDKVLDRRLKTPFVPTISHSGDISHFYDFPEPFDFAQGTTRKRAGCTDDFPEFQCYFGADTRGRRDSCATGIAVL